MGCAFDESTCLPNSRGDNNGSVEAELFPFISRSQPPYSKGGTMDAANDVEGDVFPRNAGIAQLVRAADL